MTITINLKGRFGNQLFQYAALRNISLKKGYSFYINTNLKCHGQECLLNFFNIKESSPLGSITHNYSQPVDSNFYDRNINDINDDTILDGHFENVDYFNENLNIIKDELTIKDANTISRSENFINDISKDGSKIVGVHFRRGDLIQQTQDVNEFIEKNKRFVYDSLESILKKNDKITLLIFTGGIRTEGGENFVHHTHEDDLIWIKQFSLENASKFNIHISPGTIENNELLDYSLISKCDYLITPYQSTFSFMAYYLSKKDIILYSPTNLYGGIHKHIPDNTLRKIISHERDDGFGAQYQNIVFSILYAEFNNFEYIHKDISNAEHNYNNDNNFIHKLNNLININSYYREPSAIKDYRNIVDISTVELYRHVEDNIDIYTENNQSINKIKECFWKNKDRDVFKNDKFNIAIHIRRPNVQDTRTNGTDTPDSYYLNVVNHFREKYKDKNVLFHIYSQGNIKSFDIYKNDDVVFHIDEDLCDTFIGLVGANVLVTSQSSFSYVAALISDAEVCYLPFWHKPKKNWFIL